MYMWNISYIRNELIRARWDDPYGGQNEGIKIEMIGTCEREGVDAPLKEMWKIGLARISRAISKLKKEFRKKYD